MAPFLKWCGREEVCVSKLLHGGRARGRERQGARTDPGTRLPYEVKRGIVLRRPPRMLSCKGCILCVGPSPACNSSTAVEKAGGSATGAWYESKLEVCALPTSHAGWR